MDKFTILVVDDEPAVRFGIRNFLESHGFGVNDAGDRRTALESYRNSRPDAVILDYLLPDGDTLEFMTKLKSMDGGVPILMLTAHGSIDLAVSAIKQGADQFLTKPMDLQALLLLLRREIENYRNRRRSLADKKREARNAQINPFVGTSEVIRRLEEQVHKVLTAQTSVLIHGETGTGKGVLARWLHGHSPRASEPFVDLNCAGLSRELLESEVFGHERGAFTGATQVKPGLLELGDRGTVFLDEIGDMDLQIQPKLLTVLDERRFRRLGDVRDRRVDIRLIAATNQDLPHLIRDNKFRRDLYYRINTITLTTPTLRERREDIPAIARWVTQGLGRDLGRGSVTLSPSAEIALQNYSWPGNIRELRNVMERALLLSARDVLLPEDLQFEPVGLPDGVAGDSNLPLAELERLHIQRVLAAEHGNVERAATKLGIPRSSLYDKLKRFSLCSSES